LGTSRLLIPGWLASTAFFGVVALYWYSIVVSDSRFPTLAACVFLGAAFALLTWWCIRAWTIAESDHERWVEFEKALRHRRMLLTIAYSGASALLALAAGAAGNDRSWQQFSDADPQIVAATASLVTEVHEGKDDWVANVHAVAEADGVVVPIRGETVRFWSDPSIGTPEDLELWAVFSPEKPEAGLVVTGDRDDAEAVLGFPFTPALTFVLIIFAIAWGIQLFTLKPSLYGKWPAVPIGSFPWQIWVMIAVCVALYGVSLVWFVHHSGFEGPYSTTHRLAVEGTAGIWAGMVMTTAAGMLGMVFYHSGMNSWAAYRNRSARSRYDRPGTGSPRATGADREVKRRKDRRRRQRKRKRR
jgi:hypothetical protein